MTVPSLHLPDLHVRPSYPPLWIPVSIAGYSDCIYKAGMFGLEGMVNSLTAKYEEEDGAAKFDPGNILVSLALTESIEPINASGVNSVEFHFHPILKIKGALSHVEQIFPI